MCNMKVDGWHLGWYIPEPSQVKNALVVNVLFCNMGANLSMNSLWIWGEKEKEKSLGFSFFDLWIFLLVTDNG
jgi:hypothetical protein